MQMRYKHYTPGPQRELGPPIELDEARIIIAKLLEAAERDYLNLEDALTPVEKMHFLTAESFIFEEDYRINWGGVERSFTDFCDILNINAEWYREKIEKERDKIKQQKAINILIEGK